MQVLLGEFESDFMGIGSTLIEYIFPRRRMYYQPRRFLSNQIRAYQKPIQYRNNPRNYWARRTGIPIRQIPLRTTAQQRNSLQVRRPFAQRVPFIQQAPITKRVPIVQPQRRQGIFSSLFSTSYSGPATNLGGRKNSGNNFINKQLKFARTTAMISSAFRR